MMRRDAKVEKEYPQTRGLPKVNRLFGCSGRVGYQSRGVRPRAFCISEPPP